MNSSVKSCTIFFLLLAAGCSSNKKRTFFSGTIEYAYTYESSILNSDSLKIERPVKGFFKYDQGNYQSSFSGKDTTTYSYSGRLNKCLSQTGNTNHYECEDYDVATDSVLSWKLYATGEKVLGYSCKILEMQKRNSLVKYYVSEELKIAPATYNKHKAYNMDVYGEKTGGGLILKLEHRFKNFTMKGIAVDINKKDSRYQAFQITDSIFLNHCK
ncbi:hypothetical protein [Ferruginibacter sp.]|nr:hypothetical protein [Ferruginibacter sp.]